MKGRKPKNPKTRQRVNKAVSAAILADSSPLSTGRPPALGRRPDRKKWRAGVHEFWADIWHSPMASEYTQVDVHGLRMLADLIHQYLETPCTKLAAEIRLQRQCFGLTPIDRRRMQWEIGRVEPPEKKSKTGRPKRAQDPRLVLKCIK